MEMSYMRNRVLTDELAQHAHRTIRLMGWVHRRRRLGSVSFLLLRDRSGIAQVVLTEDAARLDVLPEETVVEVEGRVTQNEQAPGGFEVVEPTISQLSRPAQTPAVELWRPSLAASLPVLLDHAP